MLHSLFNVAIIQILSVAVCSKTITTSLVIIQAYKRSEKRRFFFSFSEQFYRSTGQSNCNMSLTYLKTPKLDQSKIYSRVYVGRFDILPFIYFKQKKSGLKKRAYFLEIKTKNQNKKPTYGRQSISRPIQIVAPIPR